MTSDIEKSFKSKLRALAQEQKRDPADLWQNLMLERFLVRLAQTSLRDHFVLKGAMLLSKYIPIGRETRDLDFLAHNISNETNDLQLVFQQVARIDLNDGFKFQEIKASPLMHPHMGYPGVEVAMACFFGKIRSRISIDLGFGDIVEPLEYSLKLMHSAKGPLFENSVRLKCYPREFIFAEKLETIVFRGTMNSRMKDFHDVQSLIIDSNQVPFVHLRSVIEMVFEHRRTPLDMPLRYSIDEIKQLQELWLRYVKNHNMARVPSSIHEIITNINKFVSCLK